MIVPTRVLPHNKAAVVRGAFLSAFDEIRSFEIFKACSDDFVSALAQHAQRLSIPQGTYILREGEPNDRLRILASGSVEVRVNNERVATLSHPGDLMGEISALVGRAVTASLVALTDVTLFEILSTTLDSKIKSSPNDFGYRLYAVLARQLADKIVATNEKARQFEIGNRALIEMNKNLDLKVQERTDATIKQLMDVQASLMPLKDLLGDIASRGGPVEEAYEKVSDATDMLSAISQQFSNERSIRHCRVLIAEPDRKQQTIARMALGGTGAQLEATASIEDCLAALDAKKPDLIFVSSELASSVPDILKKAPDAKLVYMVGSEFTNEIQTLKQLAPLLSNVVSRHSSDRGFTVRNIATTVTKLVAKDPFGLEKYLMWGTEARSCAITKSSDRAGLIEEMSDHLSSLGVRAAVVDRVAAVAEELLMNAIYDAPTDNGVHHYAHLPRTTEVVLKPSEQGQFRFAADGVLAAISVSDPFGAFKIETLLNYLERNLDSNGGNVQEAGKGGAGRGLHQIIVNSDLVVFNVRPLRKTEVIAFFNLDPTSKDDQPRSFHFFAEN